jgi:hypothetical protein
VSRVPKKLREASEDLYIYRKTRSVIRSAATRLEAVESAWLDAGEQTAYHEHMKNKLRRDWPTLATALDEATK